jgi:hypothetical protein
VTDPSAFSNREIVERFTALLGQIEDDSALHGCVELLDHALPSGGEHTWTKGSLLAFALELGRLLARASVGGSIDEVDEPIADADPDRRFAYYQGKAMHRRTHGPGVEFTGTINLVRVNLPRQTPAPDHAIETAIGWVHARDHGVFDRGTVESVFSVEQINAMYRAQCPHANRVAHEVELYTGARVGLLPIGEWTSRFTPVSLFVARDAGQQAIFFVVQSAFFNGNPGKLYVAESMDHVIGVAAGFKPTPFAEPLNQYRIGLTMAGDRPARLLGEMTLGKSENQYLRVELEYVPLPGPPRSNSPLRAQVVAFSRVCAIENWMGNSHFRAITLETALHELGLRLGKLLPWFDQR